MLYAMANVKEHMQGVDALVAVKDMPVCLNLWLKVISTGITFISVTKYIMHLLVRNIMATNNLSKTTNNLSKKCTSWTRYVQRSKGKIYHISLAKILKR